MKSAAAAGERASVSDPLSDASARSRWLAVSVPSILLTTARED
jgi:hypothetical protein